MTDCAPSIWPQLTLCELPDTGLPGLESYSPFCLKVHRALRLARLPYARRHGEHPGVFRALNRSAQVPVLLVGDEPVADSTRIAHRIDEISDGALVGWLDPRTRAEAWLWEDLADTALNGYVVAARWADEGNWPRTKAAYFGGVPAVIRGVLAGKLRRHVVASLVARDVWRAGREACWERFQRTLDDLEARAPASGFWLGARATIADVALFAQLQSLRTPLTPWQSDHVVARRSLTAWLDRVDEVTAAAAAEARAA
jgi:glutathione S-transferase